MHWLVARASAVVAVGAYFLWAAASADEFDGPGLWTVLAAALSWAAVFVTVVATVRALVDAIRARR